MHTNLGNGISDTRNTGIKLSKGEYISFIDSDDVLIFNSLKKISYYLSKTNVTVLKTNVICNDIKKYDNRFDTILFENIQGKKALQLFCESNKIFSTPWSYFINRKYMIEKGFAFSSGMFHEDYGLIPFIIYSAPKVSSINLEFYNYIKRKNSTVTKSDELSEIKRGNDFLYHTFNLIDYFSNLKSLKDSEKKTIINYFYSRMTIKINHLEGYVRNKLNHILIDEINLLKENLESDYYYLQLQKKFLEYKFYDFPLRHKINIFLVMKYAIKIFSYTLVSIVLGGSAGKNELIPHWSDLDIYLILTEYNIESVKEYELEKLNLKMHVGVTYYTENEFYGGWIDNKTKIMLFEKKFKVNPVIYGCEIDCDIKYDDIKKNDIDNIANVFHEFRRLHINILNKRQLFDKKYLKKLLLLIKCFLNTKSIFCYGYSKVIQEFQKYVRQNSNSIDDEFLTICVNFDIMNAIFNYINSEEDVLRFGQFVIDFIAVNLKERVKDKMIKRVSSRGIIIDNDSVYAMFRRRIKEDGTIKEYYVIPGGGINENETLEENVVREVKEEFSVDVEVLGYLGCDEGEDSIAHFFACKIVSGIPTLGGEELERCTNENYYEIQKLKIEDLDAIDILAKDMIMKAYNKEYK